MESAALRGNRHDNDDYNNTTAAKRLTPPEET